MKKPKLCVTLAVIKRFGLLRTFEKINVENTSRRRVFSTFPQMPVLVYHREIYGLGFFTVQFFFFKEKTNFIYFLHRKLIRKRRCGVVNCEDSLAKSIINTDPRWLIVVVILIFQLQPVS